MAIFSTYSKEKSGFPEKLIYHYIPTKLKNQIFHIWNNYLNQQSLTTVNRKILIQNIYSIICEEQGEKILCTPPAFGQITKEKEIELYFEKKDKTDEVLDIIQIIFTQIQEFERFLISQSYIIRFNSKQSIDDLNTRFKENGVGYEFNNGKIIRVDNQILHKEAVQPALQLSNEPDFKNANEEYSKALDHLRFGRNSECLNECLKAFETVMKIICSKNGWKYNETDTASVLINILLANKFIGEYNESQLSALSQLLKSSIPTVRNKNSAHGQGTEKIVVPSRLANYMIYITGSTIRLFIETQISKGKN